MILISGAVQGRILNLLSRYRFMTIKQFEACGAGEDRAIRRQLQALGTAKLVAHQAFRMGPSVGRLPSSYWLTAKGAAFLSDAYSVDVVAPTSRTVEPAHAWHRMLTVDALIAADQWADHAETERPTVRTYMQRDGRKSLTKVVLYDKDADADAILETTDSAGIRRFYITEVYCSQYSEGRSMFSVNQLEPYILAGMTDCLEGNFALEDDNEPVRVLVVCDTPELKARLLRTLPKRDEMPPLDNRTWRRFLFKSKDELANFGMNWDRVDGTRFNLPT